MLSEVVRDGDLRASLEAMRDKLAADMEEAPPSVVAQIAARLESVLVRLAGLPDVKGSAVDDLVARREARRAASDAGMRARQQHPSGQ